MHHHVGGIEHIVPVGNVLDVDEINHTAIDEAIQNIAGATAYDKTKTDIFIALNSAAEPEIAGDSHEQANTDQAEYPAHALQHSEHTAVIAHMGEVNQAVQLDRRIRGNSAIDPVTDQLRGAHYHQCKQRKPEHI